MGKESLVDPVCKMVVNKNTPFKSEFNGKNYYFCNLNCKEEFEKNPRKFID